MMGLVKVLRKHNSWIDISDLRAHRRLLEKSYLGYNQKNIETSWEELRNSGMIEQVLGKGSIFSSK